MKRFICKFVQIADTVKVKSGPHKDQVGSVLIHFEDKMIVDTQDGWSFPEPKDNLEILSLKRKKVLLETPTTKYQYS